MIKRTLLTLLLNYGNELLGNCLQPFVDLRVPLQKTAKVRTLSKQGEVSGKWPDV